MDQLAVKMGDEAIQQLLLADLDLLLAFCPRNQLIVVIPEKIKNVIKVNTLNVSGPIMTKLFSF